MNTELLCTIRHIRLAGYCLPGVKAYCKEHAIDWKRFIKGVPISEMEKYNLSELNKLIRIVKREQH